MGARKKLEETVTGRIVVFLARNAGKHSIADIQAATDMQYRTARDTLARLYKMRLVDRRSVDTLGRLEYWAIPQNSPQRPMRQGSPTRTRERPYPNFSMASIPAADNRPAGFVENGWPVTPAEGMSE